MTRFYADEDFKDARVIEELREKGHDVLTAKEDGRADKRLDGKRVERSRSDEEVLARAKELDRAVLTYNRDDYAKLHTVSSEHSGIISCTRDPQNPERLARRIDKAVENKESLFGEHIRVNRPSPQELKEEEKQLEKERTLKKEKTKEDQSETRRVTVLNDEGEKRTLIVTGLRPNDSIKDLKLSDEHTKKINELSKDQELKLSIQEIRESVAKEKREERLKEGIARDEKAEGILSSLKQGLEDDIEAKLAKEREVQNKKFEPIEQRSSIDTSPSQKPTY